MQILSRGILGRWNAVYFFLAHTTDRKSKIVWATQKLQFCACCSVSTKMQTCSILRSSVARLFSIRRPISVTFSVCTGNSGGATSPLKKQPNENYIWCIPKVCIWILKCVFRFCCTLWTGKTPKTTVTKLKHPAPFEKSLSLWGAPMMVKEQRTLMWHRREATCGTRETQCRLVLCA